MRGFEAWPCWGQCDPIASLQGTWNCTHCWWLSLALQAQTPKKGASERERVRSGATVESDTLRVHSVVKRENPERSLRGPPHCQWHHDATTTLVVLLVALCCTSAAIICVFRDVLVCEVGSEDRQLVRARVQVNVNLKRERGYLGVDRGRHRAALPAAALTSTHASCAGKFTGVVKATSCGPTVTGDDGEEAASVTLGADSIAMRGGTGGGEPWWRA